jgi:predicted Zn-dependent protease
MTMDRACTHPGVGLIVVIATLVGCHGQAQEAVRALVDSEEHHLRRSAAVIRDAEVDGYLDGLARSVLMAAREHEEVDDDRRRRDGPIDVYDEFDVKLMHSADLNAWVYGDDFTCITSNLVLHAEKPEELVAVLCHEFAHLHEEHLVEAKEREYGHMFLGDLIEAAGQIADVAAYMFEVNIKVSDLTNMAAAEHRASFDPARPKDEFEADQYGLELYGAMGLDLDLYDDLFERLVAHYGDRGSATHPRLSERIKRMRATQAKLARRQQGPPRKLDLDAFHATQDRLRLVLAEAERSGTLRSLEDAQRGSRWRPRRGSAPPPTACGLFGADPARLRAGYRASFTHR